MESKKLTFPDTFVSKVTHFTSYPATQNIPLKTYNLETQKQNDFPHIVTFINFHSYIFVCPFRIVYSKETGKFQISSSKSRKVQFM